MSLYFKLNVNSKIKFRTFSTVPGSSADAASNVNIVAETVKKSVIDFLLFINHIDGTQSSTSPWWHIDWNSFIYSLIWKVLRMYRAAAAPQIDHRFSHCCGSIYMFLDTKKHLRVPIKRRHIRVLRFPGRCPLSPRSSSPVRSMHIHMNNTQTMTNWRICMKIIFHFSVSLPHWSWATISAIE